MIQFRELDIHKDWEWVRDTISPIMCADSCGVVAYQEDGIVAAGVLDSFTVDSANVHIAVLNPMALRRGFLHAVADYAFNYKGRKKIFGLTPEDKVKAVKFNNKIGMKFVTHVPDAYCDGIGYIITRMDAAHSPWLAKPKETT